MPDTANRQRFIVINVTPPSLTKEQAAKDLDELKSLVSTYGGATIVHVIQRRDHPDSHSYIGSGKAFEVAHLIKQDRIDVVVLNDIVKPGQLFNLEKIFWPNNNNIQVWDRIDLILQIFSKHANTAEAKLQIELARMRHMGPRIFGMGYVLSRQGGGIGTVGIGETNTELMKRHWRNEMKKVTDKLEKLAKDRQRQLERRREVGYKTISIIGYTNAGKTTLFNRLTGKKKLAENVLFATLDSHVGKLYLPNQKKEVLISDTIGFIQNLPAKLINAFKSTLMESVNADILLHLIDVSDPEMTKKIAVVEEVLNEMNISTKDKIYVFNKIDNVDNPEQVEAEIREQYADYNPQFISVKTDDGIHNLIKTIEDYFSPNHKENHESKKIDTHSHMNYAYEEIMKFLRKGVTHDFPHNLGLLFLIENYLSFYLNRCIEQGLENEKKFHKAHEFKTKLSEKMTLGQLFDMASPYIVSKNLREALEELIDARNTITHGLLRSTQNKTHAEEEAQKIITKIYGTFLEIHEHIAP